MVIGVVHHDRAERRETRHLHDDLAILRQDELRPRRLVVEPIGYVNDMIGGKKTIAITIVGLAIATVWGAYARSIVSFWAAAMLLAAMMGTNQAASCSLLGVFVPESKHAEFFGFYRLLGEARLRLDSSQVEGVSSDFRIEAIDSVAGLVEGGPEGLPILLAPGDFIELKTYFQPSHQGTLVDGLLIESDDPDRPAVLVTLAGTAE